MKEGVLFVCVTTHRPKSDKGPAHRELIERNKLILDSVSPRQSVLWRLNRMYWKKHTIDWSLSLGGPLSQVTLRDKRAQSSCPFTPQITPQWSFGNSSAHSLGQEVGFRGWEGDSSLARLHWLESLSTKRDLWPFDLCHPWEHWVCSCCISWALPQELELWRPLVSGQCALIQEGWDCLFTGKWSRALVFQGSYWTTAKPQKSTAKIASKIFFLRSK